MTNEEFYDDISYRVQYDGYSVVTCGFYLEKWVYGYGIMVPHVSPIKSILRSVECMIIPSSR